MTLFCIAQKTQVFKTQKLNHINFSFNNLLLLLPHVGVNRMIYYQCFLRRCYEIYGKTRVDGN